MNRRFLFALVRTRQSAQVFRRVPANRRLFGERSVHFVILY